MAKNALNGTGYNNPEAAYAAFHRKLKRCSSPTKPVSKRYQDALKLHEEFYQTPRNTLLPLHEADIRERLAHLLTVLEGRSEKASPQNFFDETDDTDDRQQPATDADFEREAQFQETVRSIERRG